MNLNRILANISSFMTTILWWLGIIFFLVGVIGGFSLGAGTSTFQNIPEAFGVLQGPFKWIILGTWGFVMALSACVAAVLLDIMENTRKVADALMQAEPSRASER